jgi:hypothetical protein
MALPIRIIAVIEQLELQPTILIGHSMGALHAWGGGQVSLSPTVACVAPTKPLSPLFVCQQPRLRIVDK